MLVTRSLALVMKISTLCVILSVGSLLSTSSHAGDRRVGDPTVPRYASKAAHELLSLVLWEVTGIPNHPLKEALRERLIDETYAGVEDTREYMRREELELIRSRPDLIQLEADFRFPYVAYPDTSRIERLSGVSILRVFVVGPRMSGMDALKVLDGFPTFDLLKTSGLPSVSDVVLEY